MDVGAARLFFHYAVAGFRLSTALTCEVPVSHWATVGLRVKMCVWLGVSRGLDLAFLNAD